MTNLDLENTALKPAATPQKFEAKSWWSERKAAKKLAQEQKRIEKLKTQVRTPEEISTEYATILREAGQCQFQIETLKAELQGFNNQLFRLNKEYLQAAEVHKDTAPTQTPQQTQPEAPSEDLGKTPDLDPTA